MVRLEEAISAMWNSLGEDEVEFRGRREGMGMSPKVEYPTLNVERSILIQGHRADGQVNDRPERAERDLQQLVSVSVANPPMLRRPAASVFVQSGFFSS